MNRDERRKRGIAAVPTIPAPEAVPDGTLFGLIPVMANEQTGPDGVVVKVLGFQVVTPDGTALIEETEFGQQPVLISSVPIPMRRSILVSGAAPPRG